MPTKRCCCQGGCLISLDNFNRANNVTLGTSWIDTDGVWTIDSAEALSIDPGVAVYDVDHPLGVESMTVYFTTVDEVVDSGMKYRVLCNVLDEANFHFVEFERNGANDSVLSLGKTVGGSESILKSDTIVGLTNTRRQVFAKFAANEFCGTVSNAVLSFVGTKPDVIAGGIRTGIQAMEAGMRIDDHTFEHHRSTRDECAHCLCLCENEYIPPVLNANITGTGRLTSLNADILLEWDRLDGTWRNVPVTLCTPGQTWRLRFFCPENIEDGSTAGLAVETGCNNSDGFATTKRDPNSYTCNPLEWVFGPYNVTIFDLACGCGNPFTIAGTYTIVITEAP